MRVVAMFRVSTESQATEGASLDAQERIYRTMAERNGWKTVAEFRGCESATQAATDRRVLQQVLACIRESDADAVYVHEQSRLTRGDELEVAMLMRELKERKVKIIVNGVVRDLSSIDERLMVGLQGLIDRSESERIKERMGRGRKERARQGRKCSGPAPYGYRNPAPGQQGRGTLQIVEAEAAVVRRIFELFAAGKGKRAIAEILNHAHVPSPNGGQWGGTTVARTATNPAYIGVSAANVWIAEKGSRTFKFQPNNPNAIWVENAHPAIIEKVLWDAVHHRTKPPRTKKPRMLTGLLYLDGRKYAGESGHGRSFYVDAGRKPGCAWLDTQSTDDLIWSRFAALATGPAFVEKLLREAQSPRQQELAEQEIEWLTDSIKKAETRLNRLVDMRSENEIDKATFLAKASRIKQEMAHWQQQLFEQRAKVAAFDESHADRIAMAVKTVLAGQTRLTVEQKRLLLGSVVGRVDLKVARTGAKAERDRRGRIIAGPISQWRIESVVFKLRLSAGVFSEIACPGVLSGNCLECA